jgi:hypothetical protein
MTIEIVRKPPVGKKFDSLRVLLDGNHTLKQKLCMFSQLKYLLQNEPYNVHFAGPTHVYVPLIDQWGHPLTHFPDGREISECIAKTDSPYHCAADHYDRRYSSPVFPAP